jgi:hypothetical protein
LYRVVGFRIQDSGFRVRVRVRVQGSGFRVWAQDALELHRDSTLNPKP